MRKITPFLFAFSLLVVTPAFAGTVVDKPALPENFTSWPYRYSDACSIKDARGDPHAVDVSVFAVVGAEDGIRQIESVTLWLFEEKFNFIFYTVGRSSGDRFESFFEVYYRINEEKVLHRSVANADDQLALIVSSDTLSTLIANKCPKVSEGMYKFFEELNNKK